MCEDYSADARNPLAIWNPARDVWETESIDLLSEHSDVYSATWPVSGMTHAGVAYERPTPAPPTTGSAFSLLRTPCAAEAEGGPLHPDTAKAKGQTLRLTGQILAHTGDLLAPMPHILLKTPTAQLAVNGGAQHPDQRKAGGHGPTLADEIEHLLPTPLAIAAQLPGVSSGLPSTDGLVSSGVMPPPLSGLMDETDETASTPN